MKSKIIKLFEIIFILSSFLFASDMKTRFDREITFDSHYDNFSNLDITPSPGAISMHTISYSVAYKFDNGFIFGYSLLSPAFLIRIVGYKDYWTLNFPSAAYALHCMYEFPISNTPYITFAAGVKSGYWENVYRTPAGHSDYIYFISPSRYKTEYFGGPIISLSLGSKKVGIVAKGGLNFGTKKYKTLLENQYTNINNDAFKPAKFAIAPEISIGLRFSHYTGVCGSGSEPINLRPQAVYLEFFGLSGNSGNGIFSLNYENIIIDHLALRGGFSFSHSEKTACYRFPVSATYLLGKERIRIEFGAGTALDFPGTEYEKHIINRIYPICGIRYQGEKTGIIWRVAYTPYFDLNERDENGAGMWQCPSFSVGYSFPGRKKI